MQKLRLEWNYHSNAIEGNRLNYGETVAFLMTGITAKGKSLKDHLNIRGHNEAILFLLSIVKDERNFTESDIRALHEMILVEPYDSPAKTADGTPTKKRITLGEYKTSANHVKTITGEIHYYASPEETPAKMQELMDWYKEASQHKEIHPFIKLDKSPKSPSDPPEKYNCYYGRASKIIAIYLKTSIILPNKD